MILKGIFINFISLIIAPILYLFYSLFLSLHLFFSPSLHLPSVYIAICLCV